jgi:hypothetical protein
LRRVDTEPRSEFLGQPLVQQARAGVGLDAQQFGPDDGNHPALFDETQQIVPSVFIEC